jgi:hypothetical protein
MIKIIFLDPVFGFMLYQFNLVMLPLILSICWKVALFLKWRGFGLNSFFFRWDFIIELNIEGQIPIKLHMIVNHTSMT